MQFIATITMEAVLQTSEIYHSSRNLNEKATYNKCISRTVMSVWRKVGTFFWIFRKWDVGAWNGLIWLRIGTGGGHL